MTTLKESEVTANLRTTNTNLSHNEREVFTDDKNHTIKYRTLSWQSAAYIMVCKGKGTHGTVRSHQTALQLSSIPL